MKLTIKITKEVLMATKMCNSMSHEAPENCAISFAVREVLPTAKTYNSEIHIETIVGYEVIDLPKVAQKFILRFDAARPKNRPKMKPISFDIEVPDSVIESIGIEQAKEIISKSSTLELIES